MRREKEVTKLLSMTDGNNSSGTNASAANDATLLAGVQQALLRRSLYHQTQAFLRLALAENSGASLDTATEASPNLQRLLITLELCLHHEFRATGAGVSRWFDGRRTPWSFVETLPRCCPRATVPAAEALVSTVNELKCSAHERIRMFMLKALMEKQLSDYLRFLSSGKLNEWYEPTALVRSDEWLVLLGLLDGLQGLECTFFVKDHGWSLTPALIEDYLVTCDTSFSDPDVQSALKLGEKKGAPLADATELSLVAQTGDQQPEATLHQRLAMLTNQNAYLEETQRQLKAASHTQQVKHDLALEIEHEAVRQAQHERNQMQAIILELQDRLADYERRDMESRHRLSEWNDAAKQWEAEMHQTQLQLQELHTQLLEYKEVAIPPPVPLTTTAGAAAATESAKKGSVASSVQSGWASRGSLGSARDDYTFVDLSNGSELVSTASGTGDDGDDNGRRSPAEAYTVVSFDDGLHTHPHSAAPQEPQNESAPTTGAIVSALVSDTSPFSTIESEDMY